MTDLLLVLDLHRMGDDSLVPVELPIPDVIKIDVEGEEEEVLRSSLKTLSKFLPLILCDYNDNPQ
jgi:hypothetical protein